MSVARADMAAVMVLTATIALAFKGILAKLAYNAGLGVEGVLLLRFGVAVPLFWIGAVALRRRPWGLGWRDWGMGALTGSLFFVATWADFTAVGLIGVSLSRVVLFTYPAMVLVLEALRDRRWPAARHMVSFAVTYGGLWLVVAPQGLGALSDRVLVGVGASLISASTFALYLVSIRPVMNRIGSVRFTALTNTVPLLLSVVSVLGMETPAFAGAGAAAIGWGAAIALFATVLPFYLLNEGIRRAGAGQAALISLCGPAISVFFAWLLLGEALSVVQLAGFAVVLGGVALLQGVFRLPWRRAPVMDRSS